MEYSELDSYRDEVSTASRRLTQEVWFFSVHGHFNPVFSSQKSSKIAPTCTLRRHLSCRRTDVIYSREFLRTCLRAYAFTRLPNDARVGLQNNSTRKKRLKWSRRTMDWPSKLEIPCSFVLLMLSVYSNSAGRASRSVCHRLGAPYI
jgi:hypothetical protein